jgi:heme exporter protein D
MRCIAKQDVGPAQGQQDFHRAAFVMVMVYLITFSACNSQPDTDGEDPFLQNSMARQEAAAGEDPLLARARARMERINSEIAETVHASVPASASAPAQQGSGPLEGYTRDWREQVAGERTTVNATLPTPEGSTMLAQAATTLSYFIGFVVPGFVVLWLLSRAAVFIITSLRGRASNTPWLAYDLAVYGIVVLLASYGFANGGQPRFWYAFGMYLLPALVIVVLDAPKDRTLALASVAIRRRRRKLRRSIGGFSAGVPKDDASRESPPVFILFFILLPKPT